MSLKRVGGYIPFCLLLALAFGAGSWWNRRSAVAASSAVAHKVLYYVDPMHPAYKSDKPGTAPDCGMQLEPVYAGDAGRGSGERGSTESFSGLKVAFEKQRRMGVRVSSAERTSITHTLRLLGRVTPDETLVYRVNASGDGYLSDVSQVTTGSLVTKNQWLATVFALDARAPIQAYLTALDVLDRAARTGQLPEQIRSGDASAQLSVERLKSIGMSALQIEEIRRTRQVPITVRILSPVDGVVLARNVSPGQKFDKAAEWYRIADLRRVWILADVYGDQAQYLRPGTRARISLPDQKKMFAASVTSELPQFDAGTRTLKVRLVADNPGYVLRPDMFADIELPIQIPPAIVIPADAVLDSGTRQTVFVEDGDGSFEPRPVETGWRFGGQVQIVKGIEPGEKVVTSGNFLLDSESRMKALAAVSEPHPSKDPVCGMNLAAGKTGYTSQYHGRQYYFCSTDCKQKFDRDPERYRIERAEGNDIVARDTQR